MVTKVCSVCKQEFPATTDFFYKQKAGKYGLRGSCISCKKEIDRKYAAENPEVKRKINKEYVTRNRTAVRERNKKYQQENKLAINMKRKRKRESWPIEKKDEIARKFREYYKTHAEIIKKQASDYRKTDKGKEIERKQRYRRKVARFSFNAEYTFSKEQWEHCKTYFENKCAYCGQARVLEQDHFIPISKGGEHTLNNVIPSCRPCNSKKLTKSFFEWYPNFEMYSISREKKIIAYLNYKANQTQQLSIL